MKENYDVVIIGAGPAGLSVGSELSKKLNVLIVDTKKELNYTSKSWFMPDLAVKSGKAEDIRPSLYNGIGRFFTSTYSGANILWNSYDYYPFVDEKSILQYWGEICQNNGADISLETLCNDVDILEDKVIINTTKKNSIEAKLIIDASGTNSFIKKKYNNQLDVKGDKLYYWSVYGAIVEFENGIPEGLKVGDYQLWQTFRDTNVDPEASMVSGRPIVEYEILNEKQAFIFVFYLKHDMVETSIMKEQFEAIMKEPTITKYFNNIKYIEPKHGWYPSGGINSFKIALDRVGFIGDAGVWTTPCGWGMTSIVASYKNYSNRIIEKVKNNTLTKSDLKEAVHIDIHTENQINIDQLVTHFLAHAPATLLDKFIKMFDQDGPLGENGPEYCEKVFTLRLDEKDIKNLLIATFEHFNIFELLRVMPKSDLSLLIETAKTLGIVLAYDKIEDLVKSEVSKFEEAVKAEAKKIEDKAKRELDKVEETVKDEIKNVENKAKKEAKKIEDRAKKELKNFGKNLGKIFRNK